VFLPRTVSYKGEEPDNPFSLNNGLLKTACSLAGAEAAATAPTPPPTKARPIKTADNDSSNNTTS